MVSSVSRWLLAVALFLPLVPAAAVSPGSEADIAPLFVDIAGSSPDTATVVALQPDGKILLAGNVVVGDQPQVAYARLLADGSPDFDFADNGQRRFSFGSGTQTTAGWIGVLANGRIGIVGTVANNNSGEVSIFVARLLPDGEFDTTFSIDGLARFGEDIRAFCGLALSEELSGRCNVEVLPDGSLLIIGRSVPQQPGRAKIGFGAGVLVYKIRPNATPDPAFGTAGRRVYLTLPGHADIALQGIGAGSLLRDDGRILIASGGASDKQLGIALLQLRPNGQPDTGFGTGGGVYVPADAGDGFLPHTLALTRGSRIMLGAHAELSGTPAFVAARFLDNGTPDASYGSGGIAGLTFGSDDPFVTAASSAMHVDSAGRAYVIGHAPTSDIAGEDNMDVAIARFTPQGLPDTAFGDGGRAFYNYDVSAGGGPFVVLRERANDVAVDGQGRMVIVGGADGPLADDRMQVRRIYTHDMFRDAFE